MKRKFLVLIFSFLTLFTLSQFAFSAFVSKDTEVLIAQTTFSGEASFTFDAALVETNDSGTLGNSTTTIYWTQADPADNLGEVKLLSSGLACI